MRDEPTSAPALLQRPLNDGWLGTRDLPAYRAGPAVARLLGPSASSTAPWRLDLLLLAPGGRSPGLQSLPCRALPRHPSHDERSRFVRVVAELARHAAGQDHSLLGVGPALGVLCEHGVGPNPNCSTSESLAPAFSRCARNPAAPAAVRAGPWPAPSPCSGAATPGGLWCRACLEPGAIPEDDRAGH